MVAIKELLRALADAEDPVATKQSPVSDIMLPLFIIPETKTLNDLLKEFKRTGQQLAVVLDEYGGTAGMITLEDILEEIVGEYADEFTMHQHRYVKKLSGSQYVIDAGIRASDLEPLVNFPFPQGDFVTLGGLVYHELGRIPSVGDEVRMDGGLLKVLEMDKHRIAKVLFQDLATSADGTIQLAEETSAPSDDDLIEEEENKAEAEAFDAPGIKEERHK